MLYFIRAPQLNRCSCMQRKQEYFIVERLVNNQFIQMGNLCIDFKKLGLKERIAYGENKVRSFTFIRRLRENKLSSVWLAQSKMYKTFCAVKVMKKLEACRKNTVQLAVNEQAILGNLNHCLISNIIQAFQDSANLYIVLEYMPYGSLRDYLSHCGNLTESQTRFVMICLLIAVEYLHKQGIAHLDIKPQNLLIDNEGYFRICDFNLSVDLKKKDKKEIKNKLLGIGTYGYQAPEVNSNPSLIGLQSDFYSIGVMCVQMLTGISKRNTDIFSTTYLKQALRERVNISNQCIDFLSKLLEDKTKKRLGAANFDDIWKHPWLQVSPTERAQYLLKQVPSFVHDQYRKSKEAQLQVPTEDNNSNADELLDRLMVRDQKFQQTFSEFKTIAFKSKAPAVA